MAGSVVAGATAYAVGSSLSGCVQETTGLLRVVEDTSKCAAVETPIVLPERGPQGPAGVGSDEVQIVWQAGGSFDTVESPVLFHASYIDVDPSNYWPGATFTARFDLWGWYDWEESGFLNDGEICARVRDLVEDVILPGSERCALASEVGKDSGSVVYSTFEVPNRPLKLAIEGTTAATYNYGCEGPGCEDPTGGLRAGRLVITAPTG